MYFVDALRRSIAVFLVKVFIDSDVALPFFFLLLCKSVLCLCMIISISVVFMYAFTALYLKTRCIRSFLN